jgi:hypothetical protein
VNPSSLSKKRAWPLEETSRPAEPFSDRSNLEPFASESVGKRRATTFSRFKNWIASWRDWEWNPVVLKELRQAARNPMLLKMLLILLSVLLLVSLFFLLRNDLLPIGHQPLGRPVFSALLSIQAAISILFVPAYIGVRLALERRESDLDLMFVTALTPGQIIRGKLLCGAYLVGMFISVGAPFMEFTTLLRGVDLPTVILIVISLYAVACLAVQAAILFACLPVRTFVKVFSGLILAGLLLAGFGGVMGMFLDLLGAGSGVANLNFWIGFGMFLLLILGAIRILFSMSANLIVADNLPRGYFNEVIRPVAVEVR